MKYLSAFTLCSLVLGVPFLAGAAYNDVTLETTAILDVGGYELTIYGSSAVIEEAVVGASTLQLTLNTGSSIVIASADRVNLSHNADSSYVVSTTCSDTESRLSLASDDNPNPQVTITITPSGTCSAPASSGGGGTSSRKPNVPPVETPKPSTESAEQEKLLAQLKSLVEQLIALGVTPPPAVLALIGDTADDSVYTRDLDVGMEGDDVNALQLFLIAQNKGPAAQALALNGATHLFGPLTQAALAEFQAAVGITPAAGYFGPKTRAYVESL